MPTSVDADLLNTMFAKSPQQVAVVARHLNKGTSQPHHSIVNHIICAILFVAIRLCDQLLQLVLVPKFRMSLQSTAYHIYRICLSLFI
eukprot:scaffold4775_cov205-Skeletonema_menzelii.AAC.1